MGAAGGYNDDGIRLGKAVPSRCTKSDVEEHIQAAESAISQRLHEFALNYGGTPEENLAITKAVTALDSMRKDVAAWKLKQR